MLTGCALDILVEPLGMHAGRFFNTCSSGFEMSKVGQISARYWSTLSTYDIAVGGPWGVPMRESQSNNQLPDLFIVDGYTGSPGEDVDLAELEVLLVQELLSDLNLATVGRA